MDNENKFIPKRSDYVVASSFAFLVIGVFLYILGYFQGVIPTRPWYLRLDSISTIEVASMLLLFLGTLFFSYGWCFKLVITYKIKNFFLYMTILFGNYFLH